MARRIEITSESKITEEEEQKVEKKVEKESVPIRTSYVSVPSIPSIVEPKIRKKSKHYNIVSRPTRIKKEVIEDEPEESYSPSYRSSYSPSFSFNIDWSGAMMALAMAWGFVIFFPGFFDNIFLSFVGFTLDGIPLIVFLSIPIYYIWSKF